MKSTRAHPSLVWKSILMIAAVLGLSASGLVARPVRAQGDGAFFPVFVLACDAYVTMKGSAAGEGYPPECRGLGDVTVTALEDVNLHVDETALVVILGPSGSGKTTLLNLVGALDTRPKVGSVSAASTSPTHREATGSGCAARR